MNILGFSGSPRKNGNTEWAIKKILDGAIEQGAVTQIFTASELNLTPCRGCLCCTNGNGCVIKDDMQQIYVALKNADALVFGSPIYMGQMNAQSKAFMDRLFAFITPRFSPRFKEENAGKKLIIVWTQGNPDGEKFREYFDYTKKIFKMLEFDVQDVIVVAGTRNSVASEQAELNENLKQIGAKMVTAHD